MFEHERNVFDRDTGVGRRGWKPSGFFSLPFPSAYRREFTVDGAEGKRGVDTKFTFKMFYPLILLTFFSIQILKVRRSTVPLAGNFQYHYYFEPYCFVIYSGPDTVRAWPSKIIIFMKLRSKRKKIYQLDIALSTAERVAPRMRYFCAKYFH